jgi:hypothetical protein
MRCSGDPSAERAKIQGARIAWAMHRRLTGTDTPELDALIALKLTERTTGERACGPAKPPGRTCGL